MTPKKKSKTNTKQQSSFLLQPFLKPVDPHIHSDKENPVLKALFGGKSPSGLTAWTYVTKTSINNCHPFKKTELSHDLTSDDTPAETPRSLQKKTSQTRKKSSKENNNNNINNNTPDTNNNGKSKPTQNNEILKEIPLNSNASNGNETNGKSNTNENDVNVTSSTISTQKVNVPPVSKVTSPAPRFIIILLLLLLFLIKNILLIFFKQGEPDKKRRISSQLTFPISKARTIFVNSERLLELRSIVDNAVKVRRYLLIYKNEYF